MLILRALFSSKTSSLKSTTYSSLPPKVLFTYELARKLEGTKVTANCFHPGAVRTALQKKLPWQFRWIALPVSYFFRSPTKGAETAVYLASAPELKGITGQFFFDKKPIASAEASYDFQLADKLWEKSCELIGITKDNHSINE